MSDMTTIARPYAKAIFEYALATKQLAEWSGVLQTLAESVLDSAAKTYIENPMSSIEQQVQLLLSVCPAKERIGDVQSVDNLLHILANNKRLLSLPDVFCQYQALRAEHEKTLSANVITYSELDDKQKQHLIRSLSSRLQRDISLEITIDKSLLGGAVIHAGDLVIDGSVRGKLNKLETELAE